MPSIQNPVMMKQIKMTRNIHLIYVAALEHHAANENQRLLGADIVRDMERSLQDRGEHRLLFVNKEVQPSNSFSRTLLIGFHLTLAEQTWTPKTPIIIPVTLREEGLPSNELKCLII
jgi:hypothetical protein